PALEAEAQLRLSALYYWSIYDWPSGIAAAREAERLFDSLPDQVMSAQAATRFEAAGVKYAAATAKNFLGIALDYQGKTGEARASYADAVRMFGELGETPSEAVSLANIAVLDFQAGNYIEAVSTYERELGKLDPNRDRESYVTILNNLGVAQSILGNADESVAALTKALPL